MKTVLVLLLFLVGCRSPVTKPDNSQSNADAELHEVQKTNKAELISHEEWSVSLDIIKALNPNSRTSKIILIEDGEKIQVGNVAVSIGRELKYYTVSYEGIYEYDPSTGEKGERISPKGKGGKRGKGSGKGQPEL